MTERVASSLTLSWLHDVCVDPDTMAGVVGIEVEALPADAGLVGDLYRLRLDRCGRDGPSSLIVKVPTSDDAMRSGRDVGRMLNSWRREEAFYAEVVPVAGVLTPTFYGSDANFDPDGPAIVLEDLGDAAIDAAEGPSYEQATRVLRATAQLHGSHWAASPTACPYQWMPAFGVSAGLLAASWRHALGDFRERYAASIPPAMFRLIDTLPDWLEHWSAGLGDQAATLVHSDLRIDNLLFTESGVVFIDWQTALFGPAAMDVSCFVATSLPVPVRRRHEAALLGDYLDALTSAGVTLSRETLERSYDENLLWWMGQFGHNLAYLEAPTERAATALVTMVERVFTAGADRRVQDLLA